MKRIKRFLQRIGPGFVTGAADDDPSGIGTYSQTGAQFGYSQLWLALFTTPFMIAVQEMCGRIGLVTGKGLAGVLRERFSKPILFIAVFALFFANTVNIGADLGAMSDAARMLFGLPEAFWLFTFCAIILTLQIFIPYKAYAKILKWLGASLLAYIATAFVVSQPWKDIVFSTIIPTVSFSSAYVMNIVAILGTTISPYLFFWQSGEEVEEEISLKKILGFGIGKPRVGKKDIRRLRSDTILGMVFSNIVMFFIIVTAASTLGAHGIRDIQTATDAAEALRPLAGPFAHLLFTVGIIGTGFLAIPILAGSASYAISEAFGWKEGLSKRIHEAPAFYAIISIATITGLIVNLVGIPPFTMLYYAAVINGLVSPIMLFFILRIAKDKRIMGKYVNGRSANILGWTIFLIMATAGITYLAGTI